MTAAYPSPSVDRNAYGTAGTAPSRAPHRPTGVLSEATAKLLEERGLDTELCTMLGLETASAPDGGGDWVAIPFIRAGVVVNWKYRTVAKREGSANFAQSRGGQQCWWNFDALTDRSLADAPLIITEGEFDAIAAIQCGFGRVVSVPGGAPQQETASQGKYAFLADTLDLLKPAKEIILAVDADRPGVALLGDLAKRLGRGRCRYVKYPEGCKDLNDTLRRHGPAEVAKCLTTAPWLEVPGLYLMSELPPLEDPKPYVSGMSGLAEHYRLRLGDFCVITGVPGSGKSTFVNDLCCRMAHRHGWATCFASFEQTPQSDHRRMLRTWVGRKPEVEQSGGEIEIADTWVDQHFSFVVPGDEEADLEWLLDKLASAVVRYDAKLLVIDPWNELDHAKPKDVTTTEYVGWAIRQLKKFAKSWQVHLIVVAHPAKIHRNKDGSMPVPTMYDISDSAHWYNKPDVGIVIHPKKSEDGSPYTAVCVQKSRYHEKIGRPGEAKMTFVPSTARFEAAV